MSNLRTAKLSVQELKVLREILNGHSNKEIALLLKLSKRTIESYRANMLKKTHSRNIAQLTMYAVRNNLVSI